VNDAGPLRGIFDRMVAGEPADLGPYADLDPALLGDALVAYADTAPVEVAGHLEPFVTAATAGDPVDPGTGLELLASAPPVLHESVADPSFEAAADDAPEPADFDFGTGTTQLDLGDLAGGLADGLTDGATDGADHGLTEDRPATAEHQIDPADRLETDVFDGWFTEPQPTEPQPADGAAADDTGDDDLAFGG
jgi:hypothetical protein